MSQSVALGELAPAPAVIHVKASAALCIRVERTIARQQILIRASHSGEQDQCLGSTLQLEVPSARDLAAAILVHAHELESQP